MNRRVWIEPWRIDANSRYGLKHETSSECDRRAIAGLRFHRILAAAAWPSGQISVGVPQAALLDGSLGSLVATALEVSGLPPERLEM